MTYLGIKKRKTVNSNIGTFSIITRAAQLRLDNSKEWTKRAVVKIKKNRKCKKCGGNLVERNGRYGVFWGCNRYPECKFTANY